MCESYVYACNNFWSHKNFYSNIQSIYHENSIASFIIQQKSTKVKNLAFVTAKQIYY